MTFKACAIVPVYDNPRTIAGVVDRIREHLADVLVVDDGSGPETTAVLEQLASGARATVLKRDRNGGKGAAVKDGFQWARDHGFTHAFQIDADGQHDLGQIPAFVDAGRAQPDALVVAYPEYGDDAPASRVQARRITAFWVAVEVGRAVIRDAMIGFRLYPLGGTSGLQAGDRMEFDIEIAVRAAWAGVPIVNLPVAVRYPSAEEGGVSHFRMVRDNLRISWLHTRLTTGAILRWLGRLVGIAR